MPNSIHRYAFDAAGSLILIFAACLEISAQSISLNGGNVTMTLTIGTAGGQLANVVSTDRIAQIPAAERPFKDHRKYCLSWTEL